MAYDGFYGELSTRGSTNEVLNLAIQTKEEIEVLAAQAQLSADDAASAGATAGAAAGEVSGAAAGAASGTTAGATAGDAAGAISGAAAGTTAGAAAGTTSGTAAGTAAANAVVNGKVNTADLINVADPLLGAAMVGRGGQVVDSFDALGLLSKIGRAHV